MSARTEIAAALRAALPADYRIIPAAAAPDAVARVTILLWQSDVTRLEQIGHDKVRVELVLWILTGIQDPERAEGELEPALDRVISALRPIKWADWPRAERLSFGDSFHGYKLTLTTLGEIGD